jgi:pimeloyl-ACP methyl ester carboxylesterase
MASIEANGIIIEYDVQGEGEPLLLVMGLGAQLIDWPPDFVDMLLAEGFQVIRFDNRDAGLSTEFDWLPPSRARSAAALLARRRPKAGYLMAEMAADAAGLLDALGVGPAHVVGVSMGGMIAQTMAIEHPESVRSLTSIMSNTGNNRHGLPHRRVLFKLSRVKPATIEDAEESSLTVFRLVAGPAADEELFLQLARASLDRSFRPMGVLRQTAAIVASPDRTPGLRQISVPSLVIHGLADPLVRPSGGIATARAIPGSRLLMFPEMGHDMPRMRWPEMVTAITQNASRAEHSGMMGGSATKAQSGMKSKTFPERSLSMNAGS